MEAYDHRLAMCKICFEPLSSSTSIVRVLPLERDAYESELSRSKADPNSLDLPPARLGTIDTINFIRQDNSAVIRAMTKGASNSNEGNYACDLHLVLGNDTYLDLMKGKWKEAERCDFCISTP